MDFRKWVYASLSQYKIDSLGIEEDGIFHYRGRRVLKGHILPYVQREKNILEHGKENRQSGSIAPLLKKQIRPLIPPGKIVEVVTAVTNSRPDSIAKRNSPVWQSLCDEGRKGRGVAERN